MNGSTSHFDDVNVPQGLRQYELWNKWPAELGESEPQRTSIRVGPFNMVVLGDSVSWRQGLGCRNTTNLAGSRYF